PQRGRNRKAQGGEGAARTGGGGRRVRDRGTGKGGEGQLSTLASPPCSIGARSSFADIPLFALLARFARPANGHDLGALGEATMFPLAGKDLSRDMGSTRAVRKIVAVRSFVPVGVVPDIAAASLAATGNERSFEPVDRPAMLKPLHHATARLDAATPHAPPDCRL